MISGFKVITNRSHMKGSELVAVSGHLVDSSVITSHLCGAVEDGGSSMLSRGCSNWGFADLFVV